MFQTIPLYFRLAKLPVIPMPNHVATMWSGVLKLYQSGAFMWSFGILLAVLIYGIQLDVLDVLFVISLSLFGLVALLQPRRAFARLLRHSRCATFDMSLERYFAIKNLPDSAKEIMDLDGVVRSVFPEPGISFNFLQILATVGSQLVPLIPFAARAVTSLVFVR